MISRFVIYIFAKFNFIINKDHEEDAFLANIYQILLIYAILEVIIVSSIIYVQIKNIVEDSDDDKLDGYDIRSSMMLRNSLIMSHS